MTEEPLTMHIYNADGSRAKMCGNGLRCFTKMLVELGFGLKNDVKTDEGIIGVECISEEPFLCKFDLTVNEEKDLVTVSGTRHVVLFEAFDDDKGRKVSTTMDTNVDFVQVVDRNTIQVTTWERGVGRTEACGTGAVASVYQSRKHGFIEQDVTVVFQYEKIHCFVKDNRVNSEGTAVCVFEGKLKN